MIILPEAYTPASSSPGRLAPEDRLVFQHFPKTAGTTVHHCLAASFDPAEICPERFGRFAFWPPQVLERYRFFSCHASGRELRSIPAPLKTISFFRNPIERCISLYEYWRSIPLSEQQESELLEPRFARSYSPRAFFALTGSEQRRPFCNVYTAGLAGDSLFSPSGRIWQSDHEMLEAALERLEQLSFIGISEDMTGSMDALCRQLDIPNPYVGQFFNVTKRGDALESGGPGQAEPVDIDDECLGLIAQANQLDMIVYDRALTLALNGRARVRAVRCLPGPMPVCHVRSGFADTWVENREGGYVLFGPYARLLPGRYAVAFHVRRRVGALDGWNGASLGQIEVIARKGGLVLAQSDLQDFVGEASPELTFEVSHMVSDAEFRVVAAPGAPFDVELTVRLRQT